MKRLNFIILLWLMTISITAVGQNGTIRGTVIEEATGEPLYGVTVVIKGTTNGSITDFDGKFQIPATPGSYDIQASFVSFQTVTISGLEVKPNEVTLIDQIPLKEDVELLEEVVVTAEVIRTTEAALLTVKRKSPNLLDGISSASFRKIGDSDAAAAAKRITGVSIEGGKYVFVRGLGDRYTKTLLNGMDVPGLDPDRNTLQMDIFPTNVLNNIMVAKTFTPDLPADFTGGLVNIETKDLPDEKTMNMSLGLGFNPSMHFNSNNLTYNGGSTDFLGFDDGTRSLHINDDDVILNGQIYAPTSPLGQQYAAQLRGFNRTLGAERKTNFMDYNFGYSFGNQKETSLGSLGYNFALTYRKTSEFYEGAVFSRYGINDSDPSDLQLERREFQSGDYGVNNVLLGGMAGLALKRDKAKYRLNILRLQNGENKAGIFDYVGSDEGSDFVGIQHNLEYSQRALTNLLFAGDHYLKNDSWQLNWKVSPTLSSIKDPDIRFTRYQVERGEFQIGSGEAGFPRRIWRDLNEYNIASTVGVTKEHQLFGRDAKLKFGGGSTFKSRDFSIRTFSIIIGDDDGLTGNPDELFYDENLYPEDGGNFYSADFVPRNINFFESSILNNAFYVSSEFSATENLKAIVGVRAEDYSQLYTGQNSQGLELKNEKVVDELNFFPSVNLIYSLTDRQNLRASYSRTTARFSFKEASFAEIFDPLTGRTFLGALSPARNGRNEVIWDGNIKSTLIDNFDLRWEIFQNGGQTISVSGFYKKFNDAIETVQSATADNNFQPRNLGDATVIGTELEIRQSLGKLTSALENFTVSGNFTYLKSEITMGKEEYESRLRNVRNGETLDRTRELQGQAPYLINVGFAYNKPESGLEAGLYYNVQGATLTYTGIADRPDVYSVPFNSVNLSVNKTFGQNDKYQLNMRVRNLLGDKRELVYKNFGSSDQPFQTLDPGTRVSVTFRYSLF
ncbi:TonB-dependent receptor [Ekhidna sp.]|uniref:TonB-dependent receptor n=1 Tax=Ekhidna sp. TaxID=2608089 RepID=UPI0032980989